MTSTPPLTAPTPDTARGLRVVGLDISLTATGVASKGWTDTLRPHKDFRGHARLSWIRDAVADHTRTADLVVVEGPSYGSVGGSAHERAGLWWLITHSLWRAGTPYAVVSPSGRAKYATGKGNADKDAVLVAAVRRFPGYEVANNNEADALIVCAAGYDHLGVPLVLMPDTHRAALAAVDWPDVGAVVGS